MEAISGYDKLAEFYSAGITCGFEPAAVKSNKSF